MRTGQIGDLPRFTDAVQASRIAQAMVDQALAGPVPSFGDPAEWQAALEAATAAEAARTDDTAKDVVGS